LNGGDKTMTRQCPECERTLELNEINFRKFNGSWRSKCRDCQNKRKRIMYRKEMVSKPEKPNPFKTVQQARVQAQIDKFDKVFKLLKKLGVSPDAPAEYVDKVLEAAQRKTAC